jgi:hypothetical protein
MDDSTVPYRDRRGPRASPVLLYTLSDRPLALHTDPTDSCYELLNPVVRMRDRRQEIM